jgi:phage terminase large subunit
MDRTEGDGIRLREIIYQALPSQLAFHQCGTPFKGFSGPVGCGKSQALCQEAIKLAYINSGRMGLIGAPTYPMLRDVTQQTLFEILEANRIPIDFNKAENLLRLKDCQSRIIFRAVDDFERLRGTNLAWFGLDELTYTPEEAWLRLEARLRDPKATRLCGFASWTPRGFDWVYRKFISEPVEGYKAILARPFENKFLLDKTPEFYQRLQRSYDSEFYRQEVLGEYLNLHAGLVYHGFNRLDNVKEVKLNAALPLLWSLDFNVNPLCSVVAQIDGGIVHVLEEIILHNKTTGDACEEFARAHPHHSPGIVVYGDASANQHNTISRDTNMTIIRERLNIVCNSHVSYEIPPHNPPVSDRVQVTNSLLRNAAGDIRMFIHPRCKELIRDFEQVCYKRDSDEIDKNRDPKRTHASDALGYLLHPEFQVRPVIGEKGSPLLWH